MRRLCIGLVCEGPTDVVAIKTLLGETLRRAGIAAEFEELQPLPDRTRKNPQAGWGNVEAWLKRESLADRLEEHVFGGIFDDDLSSGSQCDVLLVQIDGDNLDDEPFRVFNKRNYDLDVASPTDPAERFDAIATILAAWSSLPEEMEIVRERHILAPAIENTETWCLAAFDHHDGDIELIGKAEQGVPVSAMIATLEGREVDPAAVRVPKGVNRRKAVCEKLSEGDHPTRLIAQSRSFGRVHDACVSSPHART